MKNRRLQFMIVAMAAFLASGCAETQLLSHWAKQVSWPGQQESKSAYKVGNPYKVGSVWYYPEENFRLVETGIASWYGPGFHEGKTSNGEIFDQRELTAAHRTLQLPSLVRVTNLENGHSVVVRVNDRGPFKHGRIMDVSRRAAELLGFINKGTARIRLEVLEKESRILADAARRGEDTTRLTMADINDRPMPPVQTATASPAPAPLAEMDATPESLRTPTITVEALKSPGASPAITPIAEIASASSGPAPLPAPASRTKMAAGSIQDGRFMPAAEVSTEPVSPTGIFVQAGSFSVYSNAERLTKKLVSIAPTIIDPVTVNGRKMYRVKLGPISSVADADNVLEKVIHSGGLDTARVIKVRKN